MDTLEFLQRVLPDEGTYCAAVLYKDVGDMKQYFFEDRVELADFLLNKSADGDDTYYAISSFKSKRRNQTNVLQTKVVAFDIDCNKVRNSYASKKEALAALSSFVKTAEMPKPTIVSSGMGLHVYWVFDTPLESEQFDNISARLKLKATMCGLIIDPTVTTDSARILRAPGTVHTKSGAVVSVMLNGDTVSYDQLDAILPTAPKRTTLLDNLKPVQDFPQANAHIVKTKCRQIKWAVNHQNEVDEPLWYALMGIAAFTTDPHKTAINWSDDHPQYNEADTLAKVDQWTAAGVGPTTCAKFEILRPGGCDDCPFKNKIASPVRLGAVYKEEEVGEDAPDPVSQQVSLSKPFKRTTSGIKISIDEVDMDVCPFDIYPVGYGKDDSLGYETVRFHWNRPHVGWCELSFRQALLTDGHRDFATTMADQGIVLNNKKQTEYFQIMLRSYMDNLRRLKGMTNLYATMGWKEDFKQFVLGDKVFKHAADGTVVEELTTMSSVSRSSTDMYGTAGTVESWAKGTRLLEVTKMPAIMFALGVSFAAPLFAFTGLKGLTISLYGPTGGGKTLAQYWMQSVYGNPDKLHFAAKFTQNTLFSRLGLYSNLPMTIDEATMISDKEIGDFLYWVSQGRDKARLNRNAEERTAKTWATPVVVSTNVSLQSKLVSSGLDTDAQFARLLEVSVPSHSAFSKNSDFGHKIYNHIMGNYGCVGQVYISELIRMGRQRIIQEIELARKSIRADYGVDFTGEERFWEQAVVLQEVGSRIAHRLGLIKYDYTTGTRWLLESIGAIRQTAADDRLDSFDVIGNYLNENADAALSVFHTGSKAAHDLNSVPNGDIRIRYDLYRSSVGAKFDSGKLTLDRVHFRKWLSAKNADYRSIVNEMRDAGILATPKSAKFYMAKDTGKKLGQISVIAINLNHPRLDGILNDADDALSRAAERKLSIVINNKDIK